MPKNSSHTAPEAHQRPPIVAIVGHIDHGKSTLLDYIRKSNVVAGEAGGITQHLSAYEAAHNGRVITFLDTPGHEAFKAMRSRGLEVADVAILVVSAEDGVKPQTLEAVKLIEGVGIPYIVALTKADKPGANLDRAKSSLLENGIYLEGMGGSIPSIAVSGKTGQGIPELLDLILLAGELEGLSADLKLPAEGVVIEAHVDAKRGTSATLIIQNGSLISGKYVVSGESFAPVRIMENFLGKSVKEAHAGSPVRIIGFSSLPDVGSPFIMLPSKKEAEEKARVARLERLAEAAKAAHKPAAPKPVPIQGSGTEEGEAEAKPEKIILPLLIKTDVAGTGEAVVHEIKKLTVPESMELRVVGMGVGSVSEADVKAVTGALPGLIVGFNVKVDTRAHELAERDGIAIGLFDIIYKLAEWVAEEIEKRRPRERVEEKTGSARILKIFSTAKGKTVLGGRVEEGLLKERAEVRIMRHDLELGRGEIVSLQSQKKDVKEVEAGSEFGAMVSTKVAVASGDYLECVNVSLK